MKIIRQINNNAALALDGNGSKCCIKLEKNIHM